ncbi:MAG: HTH-type transcriptional repressor CarH [bacterium]|nr:HTH-type transcriptional repressor CarH [bacterium]
MQKNEQMYPIKLVSRRTGLSMHAIRIWEKRYNAVSPERTETNRRLYSEADMERLLLLHKATLDGHAIGQIAKLPTEQLRQLLHTTEVAPSSKSAEENKGNLTPPEAALEHCLQFVKQLDPERLKRALEDAEVALSKPRFIEQLVAPLMQKIGEMWRDGTLRVVHEHMATAVTRSFLGNVRSAYEVPETAPGLIVTTPVGQLHELGALMASATAAAEGWRVIYLGPNLPAEEIAAAARQNQARAVALSIVYPADDPRLETELQKLRRLLPDEAAMLIGGRAAPIYRALSEMPGVQLIKDMASFSAILETLRLQRPG